MLLQENRRDQRNSKIKVSDNKKESSEEKSSKYNKKSKEEDENEEEFFIKDYSKNFQNDNSIIESETSSKNSRYNLSNSKKKLKNNPNRPSLDKEPEFIEKNILKKFVDTPSKFLSNGKTSLKLNKKRHNFI